MLHGVVLVILKETIMKKIFLFALLCTFSLAATAQIIQSKKDKINNKVKKKSNRIDPKIKIDTKNRIPLIAEKKLRLKNNKIKTSFENGQMIIDGQSINDEINVSNYIDLNARNTFSQRAYLISRNKLDGFSNTITLERGKGYMDIYFPNTNSNTVFLVELDIKSRRSATLKTQHPRTYETSTFSIRGNNETQTIRFLFHPTGNRNLQVMSDQGFFDIKNIKLQRTDLEVF